MYIADQEQSLITCTRIHLYQKVHNLHATWHMYVFMYRHIHTHTYLQTYVCVQCVFGNWICHPVKYIPLIIVWFFSSHNDCIVGSPQLYIMSFFSNLGERLSVIEEEWKRERERYGSTSSIPSFTMDSLLSFPTCKMRLVMSFCHMYWRRG